LEPGAVIRKKYEILSEIGRGGMGVVYRARHLVWNEEKALKVLVASVSEGQPGLKSLMAEALVMRQLQHPHIVRVEDADYTEDDQPFVVMEYVEGQSCGKSWTAKDRWPPELALQIAAQTCSALSAAHQKGIIHRDIKPQNLLLAKSADGSETVKVIDFGIAKVREEAGLGFTGMMTGTTGFFVGTPAYASPEQALGMRGSDLDGRVVGYFEFSTA
jgi:serine/threonine-protein kinase